MLVIVDEKIIVEDGQEYRVKTYSNGTVVKESIIPPSEVEPVEPEPTQLDRIEEQVNAIANGATAETTAAMDALLTGEEE